MTAVSSTGLKKAHIRAARTFSYPPPKKLSGSPQSGALRRPKLILTRTCSCCVYRCYDIHFQVHSVEGFVDAMSAKACLEEASGGEVPNEALAAIWVLCDADGDGRLGRLEFMLAIHLVLHMVRCKVTTMPQVIFAHSLARATCPLSQPQ